MLWHDVRIAVRTLARSRASTSVAVVSLGLAIGAIAAVFSLRSALFARDLRVREPEALVAISAINPDRPDMPAPLSLATVDEIRRRDDDFAAVVAWRDAILRTVEANGVRFAGNVNEVGGDYFAALGVEPLIGRALDAHDVSAAGAASNPVAVLDYRCWDRRFGRDPNIVGKTLVVDGIALTIVGVMPRSFLGLNIVSAPDATVPIGFEAGGPSSSGPPAASTYFVAARLGPGRTIEQAANRLRALWPSILEATVPPMARGPQRAQFLASRAAVESLRTGTTAGSNLRQQFAQPLVQLLALSLLVLLVATVNMANLLLLRTAARRHQLGLRASLGATMWRLVRSVAIEGTLVALAGSALGLLIAMWLAPLLLQLLLAFQPLKPLAVDPRPDLRVVALAAAVAVIVGLASATAPAWQLLRGNPIAALVPQSRGGGNRTRFQRVLVCTQLALAVVLTSAALLFGRSLYALTAVDPGFRTGGVLQMRPFPQVKQPIPERTAYYHAVADALAALPGVDAVSYSQPSPLVGVEMARPVAAGGSSDTATAVVSFVGPAFFKTMGMHVQGRDIEWRDDERSPRVAVISRSLAQQLFHGRDAIGRTVAVPGSPYGQGVQIVGVADDASLWTLRSHAPHALFLALMQAPAFATFSIQLHASGDLTGLAAAANRTLDSFGRHSSFATEPLGEQVKYVLRDERAVAGVSAFLAGVTGLLAAAGLYGLLAYVVGLRCAEIGVRLAIGARPGDIARMVLKDAIVLTAIGLAIGVPASVLCVRLASTLVAGVAPYDAPTLAATVVALAIVTLAAAYVPMRRAAGTDPLAVLRSE